MKKFGEENFRRSILFEFDNPGEMLAKEAELVNDEWLSRRDTYNRRLGGSPSKRTHDAKAKFRTAFGQVLSGQLACRQMTPVDLARISEIAPSYLSQMMSGRRSASPSLVDSVADRLALKLEEREELHKAAAKDLGYKLDLTKPG